MVPPSTELLPSAAPSSVHHFVATPNRLHYVRDFTYDEDRCRVYVRDLPRNLASLTNTAISIIRCQPEFQYLPEANRHFAARPQEALDLLLTPPGR